MEKIFYRRHLPHYAPGCVDYFITYHLAGSLPANVVRELQEQYRLAMDLLARDVRPGVLNPLTQDQRSRIRKRYFAGYDSHLDSLTHGPKWLTEPTIASIVQNGLLKLVEERHYHLWCYTIMGNHVHVLFQHPASEHPDPKPSLRQTMQLLKGRSAYTCNRALGRTGAFWQDESYDHVVRDGEFERIVLYILNNPVKAGLVNEWSQWPWTFVHPTIRDILLLA